VWLAHVAEVEGISCASCALAAQWKDDLQHKDPELFEQISQIRWRRIRVAQLVGLFGACVGARCWRICQGFPRTAQNRRGAGRRGMDLQNRKAGKYRARGFIEGANR